MGDGSLIPAQQRRRRQQLMRPGCGVEVFPAAALQLGPARRIRQLTGSNSIPTNPDFSQAVKDAPATLSLENGACGGGDGRRHCIRFRVLTHCQRARLPQVNRVAATEDSFTTVVDSSCTPRGAGTRVVLNEPGEQL